MLIIKVVPLKFHKRLLLTVLSFIILTQQTKSQKYHAVNQEEETILRNVISQANWVANQSYPEMCFIVLNLSCRIYKNSVNDLINANLMFKKIKSKHSRLVFLYLESMTDINMLVSTDASYANLPDRSPHSGQHTFPPH